MIAVDLAHGMLAAGAAERPPAVVGDAVRLPVAGAGFDAAVAMFSLNHLARPALALRELTRVLRPGGGLVATAYSAAHHHPVNRPESSRSWPVQPSPTPT